LNNYLLTLSSDHAGTQKVFQRVEFKNHSLSIKVLKEIPHSGGFSHLRPAASQHMYTGIINLLEMNCSIDCIF